MTLHAKVSCSPACDLRGHILLVKDQAGAEVGRVDLTEFDGVTTMLLAGLNSISPDDSSLR